MFQLPFIESQISDLSVSEICRAREELIGDGEISSVSTHIRSQYRLASIRIAQKLPPISKSTMQQNGHIYRGTLMRRVVANHIEGNLFKLRDFLNTLDEEWVDFTRPGKPHDAVDYALKGYRGFCDVSDREDAVVVEIPFTPSLREEFESYCSYEPERPGIISIPKWMLVEKSGRLYRPVLD